MNKDAIGACGPITRRQFIQSSTVMVGGLVGLVACSAGSGIPSYAEAEREVWDNHAPVPEDHVLLLQQLVRYATLAPSSHNTQCWKFHIEPNLISILPDWSRRCPAVDPDDHHVFVSLGCALENLCQAAQAHGLKATVSFDAVDDVIRVGLTPAKSSPSPLFDAIPKRQSTRSEFDGKALASAELELLKQAAKGDAVQVMLLTETAAKQRVLDYVIQGNSAQMDNPAFVDELKKWIRFSDEEAVSMGDGLSTHASGNPSVPRWLASPLFAMLFTKQVENEKYARQIQSSAGIAIFYSAIASNAQADKTQWIEVGRCYQRFALQSTALGIRNAFVNQPVEVNELRPKFASSMGLGGYRPDLLVRFGRGAEMPRSLRRPLQSVLV